MVWFSACSDREGVMHTIQIAVNQYFTFSMGSLWLNTS